MVYTAGTPALTSRQMKEVEMKTICNFLNEAIELAVSITASLTTERGNKPSFKVSGDVYVLWGAANTSICS